MVNLSPFWSLAFRLSLLGFFTTARGSSQCYYPDGSMANDDIPCYTDGRYSHCCASNTICLDNKLCLSASQPYAISRGSCTDRAWSSSLCPSHCNDTQGNGGTTLHWYSNGTKVTNDKYQYCCNSVVVASNGTLVCSNINGETQTPFEIDDGKIMGDVAALNGTAVARTQNETTTSDSDSSTNSKRDVAIGAGVGVPLGVIAILSIAWALYERRLRKKTPESIPAPVSGHDYTTRPTAYQTIPSELPNTSGPNNKPAELSDSTTTQSYH